MSTTAHNRRILRREDRRVFHAIVAQRLQGVPVSGQYPIFWLASGLIFFANALFSVAEGYWLLGLLQIVTAGMATIAATYSRHARPEPDNSSASEASSLNSTTAKHHEVDEGPVTPTEPSR
jgi:hypothetical protein